MDSYLQPLYRFSYMQLFRPFIVVIGDKGNGGGGGCGVGEFESGSLLQMLIFTPITNSIYATLDLIFLC